MSHGGLSKLLHIQKTLNSSLSRWKVYDLHHGARPGREQISDIMEKSNNITEKRALDMLANIVESFELENDSGENETLYLYPLQLGRLAMITRRLIDLNFIFEEEKIQDSVKRLWTICSEKAKDVAEIIAISTLRTKQELDTQLNDRTNLIYWSPTMNQQALANVLYTIICQSYYADFMKAIRLVKTLQVTISQKTAVKRIANTEDKASGER